MDFFEHQDIARKKTGRLVVLMVVAVLIIIALVYGVVLLVAMQAVARGGEAFSSGGATAFDTLPHWRLLGMTVVGVLAVVGGGSLYKTSQLAGGGKTVAESLGGRRIDHDTTDPNERKLLNVVEEMAIASGTPVPGVYLLDHEDAINAFAAGWTLDDAVIGVTRGCVEQLSRDELQGVVAHEFSHILHGDMRINLRLVGLIFGILVISVVGAGIMRSVAFSGHRRSRSSNSKDGGGVIAILGIGLALCVIGYVGVFFGRLIQAAISRQREFLADASAVQFTRHPEGLADALRRIGGISTGSKLQTAHAVEHSHLFFGSAVTSMFGGALATHPPLAQRIARIQPNWEGDYLEPHLVVDGHAQRDAQGSSAQQSLAGFAPTGPIHPAAMGFTSSKPTPAAPPANAMPTAVEQIGQPTQANLDHAHQLIERVPPVLRSASHTTTGAQAIVFALLFDRKDPAVRQKQLDYLQEHAVGPVAVLAERLAQPTVGLDVGLRLLLLDLALPALMRLHPQVIEQIHAHVDALIASDERLDLFEWAMRQVLWRHLRPAGVARAADNRRLRRCPGALEMLLSVLAHVGGRDAGAAEHAFTQAMKQVSAVTAALRPHDQVSMARLTEAVDELARLTPADKKQVIFACAAAINADGEVTSREAELMRAVAETLGVPVSPVLPGQRLI